MRASVLAVIVLAGTATSLGGCGSVARANGPVAELRAARPRSSQLGVGWHALHAAATHATIGDSPCERASFSYGGAWSLSGGFAYGSFDQPSYSILAETIAKMATATPEQLRARMSQPVSPACGPISWKGIGLFGSNPILNTFCFGVGELKVPPALSGVTTIAESGFDLADGDRQFCYVVAKHHFFAFIKVGGALSSRRLERAAQAAASAL